MSDRVKSSIREFFFSPASSVPIAVLRILLAGILLIQAFLLSGQMLELYGFNGILQSTVFSHLSLGGYPTLAGLQTRLSGWGIDPDATVRGTFILYVTSLASLLVGWKTRTSTVICWATHFLLLKASFLSAYGVDQFANVFLYFLIWMPGGQAYSVDAGWTSGKPSLQARISLRFFQIELCIIYFTAGLFKAFGAQWWDGNAIWRSVTSPIFNQFDLTWLASVPWFAKLLGWSTLVLEMGYPVFIWVPRTRWLWLSGVIGLHLGIAIFLGLHSFAAVMIALSLSAFAFSPEFNRVSKSYGSAEMEIRQEKKQPSLA